jgi:hypothetical protein
MRKQVATGQRVLALVWGAGVLCGPPAAQADPVLDEDGFVRNWEGSIDGSFERIRPDGQVDDHDALQQYVSPAPPSLKARFDAVWAINKSMFCDAITTKLSAQMATNVVCTATASGELRAKPGSLTFRYLVPNNFVSFNANAFDHPNFFGTVDVIIDVTLTNFGAIEGHDGCDDSDLPNPQPISQCTQVLASPYFSPLGVGTATASTASSVFTSGNFWVGLSGGGSLLQVDQMFDGQSLDVSSSLQSTAVSFNAALRDGARTIGALLFMDDTVHPPPFKGAFQLSVQAQSDGTLSIRYSLDERPPPPPPCWDTPAGCSQNGPPSHSKPSVPLSVQYVP